MNGRQIKSYTITQDKLESGVITPAVIDEGSASSSGTAGYFLDQGDASTN